MTRSYKPGKYICVTCGEENVEVEAPKLCTFGCQQFGWCHVLGARCRALVCSSLVRAAGSSF